MNVAPKTPKPSRRNPFKAGNPLAQQFDTMLKAYAERHPDVIHPDGRRCLGNNASSAFWKGYDLTPPYLIGNGTWAWACYRAGQTQRLLDDDGARTDDDASSKAEARADVKLSLGEQKFMSSLSKTLGALPVGSNVPFTHMDGRAVSGLTKKGFLVRTGHGATLLQPGADWLATAVVMADASNR
ncbi:hypothetical protein [Burkholderia cenocepacia]|uniref:hypothetical protein n=1 Tax=Burkholderia cenocepacia TaxID=95486 RepID=UPI001B96DE71|nr:hypothetical protein [Burkholderia cenocepacia]MBR8426178.1 hypothetical protein [Burkholderia cenocepacia]